MKIGDEFDGAEIIDIEPPSLNKDNPNVKDVTVLYPERGQMVTHVVNTVTREILYQNVRG